MVHQMSMLRHLQLSFETSLLMAAASSNWNGYWQIPHAEKVPLGHGHSKAQEIGTLRGSINHFSEFQLAATGQLLGAQGF